MLEDTTLALRGLWRNRRFTLLAVLVLGAGIGGTTTVYSTVDAVLLRPLPYPNADRIAMVVRRQGPRIYGDSQNSLTFRFIRDSQRSFSAFAAATGGGGVNLVGDDQAAYIRVLSVTSDYFRVFGFQPALGRSFTPEEEEPGAASVVILSHALWQAQFSGRSGILGQEIRLMGQPYTIIGVMPPDFRLFFPVDLWTPLRSNDPRGVGTNYSVIGRLKDGGTMEQAGAEMAALTEAFLQERPRALPNGISLGVQPLQKILNSAVSQNVMMLFGAVLAMLLVVCANTAGLMLVRALHRQREFAIRAALGASRWRIAVQVLVESVVLSAIGSIIGLWFASWGIDGLLALDPSTYVRWNLGIDIRVLAAVVAGTLIVGIIVGLLPALQSSRSDIHSRLVEEGRQSSSHRVTSWRRMLVTIQVAACLVLLSAAGLLIRSFVNLQQVPLGFDGTNVLTAQMSLQGSRYDKEGRTVSFVQESLDQIRALPGVEAAAIASNLPAQRGLNVTYRTWKGDLASPDWRYVTPDYFTVFRIPLVKGRYLEATDRAGTPPAAVVNKEFIRQFYAGDDEDRLRRFLEGQEVLGARLTFVDGSRNFSFDVVGVVGDVKSGDFRAAAAPTAFVNLDQAPPEMLATAHRYYPVNVVIRTATDAKTPALADALNRIVRSVEPNLPVASVQTMDEVIANALLGARSQTTLLAVFATLAWITAAYGIYGLISYTVVTRTREFGIRMALGATHPVLIRSIVRQGLVLVSIGAALGLAGALFASRLLRAYLFGVTASDPWTFFIASLALVLVSITASVLPALRVLKLSPSVALRQE